jgi:hypothetical protein
VSGEDILRFLSRTEVRKSLPVELQAEITFGLEQSQASADDLLYLTESPQQGSSPDSFRTPRRPGLSVFRDLGVASL